MTERALEDILRGESQPVEQPAEQVQQEAQTTPPVESVEAQATGEKTASPPDAKQDKSPPPAFVPKEALVAERRQRQELEARLRAIEEQQKAAVPEEPPAELFADPSKWEEQFKARVAAEVDKVRRESQANLLNFLEAQARAQHEDFDETIQFFAEESQRSPELRVEALKAVNPVEWAYTTAKQLRRLREAGGVDKLIETIERQEEALAELKQQRESVSVPQSLSEVTGARAATSRQWSGPRPLGDILKRN